MGFGVSQTRAPVLSLSNRVTLNEGLHLSASSSVRRDHQPHLTDEAVVILLVKEAFPTPRGSRPVLAVILLDLSSGLG